MTISTRPIVVACLPLATAAATFLLAVPTEVQQPGTQPGEVMLEGAPSQCDNCHGGYAPAVEPSRGWRGSAMAHAGRDPLFWATLAIAEQDYPGAGDLCLRCHTPRGWLEGRSTPTDGSRLASEDADGVECALCHQLVDPDGSEWSGVQNPPFVAHDGGTPPQAYYGSGMMVLWGDKDLLGPYRDAVARHSWLPSDFHRSSEACGTCHDVSNPVTGDLAPGNGAQVPLPPETYSGVPGTPVTTKAAFHNFPHAYGVVERTFSEHVASAWPDTAVSTFGSLPSELQQGVVSRVYADALLAGRGGDYEDGTRRTFTCQSCHMRPAVGYGCNKSNAPLRKDLPRHDLTGGSTWLPEAIAWLDARGRLPFGGGLSASQVAAMREGAGRALTLLRGAAALEVEDDEVRVVNLTGHKLISGYPEGRRMWLRVQWLDRAGNLLREDGGYGPITATVRGRTRSVETLLDLGGARTRIWEAKVGITQAWAQKLLGLGVPGSLPLAFDRRTGAVTVTLGDLAARPPGSTVASFRFALNDTVVSDTRIPPYGMRYDEARARNILPVPADQFGDPGPGGVYEHHDEVPLQPPAGAVLARIELLYQSTSWEYVQFLQLANDGSNPALASLGEDLLDAWLATGMAPPEVMAEAIWCRLPGTTDPIELLSRIGGRGDPSQCSKTAREGDRLTATVRPEDATLTGAPAVLLLQVWSSPQPPVPLGSFPGLWLSRIDAQVAVPSLPAAGFGIDLTVPGGGEGSTLRMQGVALSAAAGNGTYATTDAHDVLLTGL